MTDNGLRHLKDLDELVSIYLSETRVTAEGADELRKMLPNLKTVGFQDLPATTQGQDYTSPSAGMKFSLIPAGTFQMGSPDTEPERNSDEGPQHTVQISQPFYMGVYEVTQSEYEIGRAHV